MKSIIDEGRPSATAQLAAMLRAAHQLLDTPLVLPDPLAIRILGAEGESTLRAKLQEIGAPRLSGLRAFIAMRSRYAQDRLARGVGEGVRQLVILGAGLDTFACRNPHPGELLRVFEVDHPATQAWKRARLREAGIAVPRSLTFAPVDLTQQSLTAGLGASGFRSDLTTFFSFLGVTPYLARDAVMATLAAIASTGPRGSEVVFDVALPPSLLNSGEQQLREEFAERARAMGEPWLTDFDPTALRAELMQLGFGEVEEFGAEAANERYFGNRADGLRVGGLMHLMRARV